MIYYSSSINENIAPKFIVPFDSVVIVVLLVVSNVCVFSAIKSVELVPESDFIGGVERDAVTFLYNIGEEVDGVIASSSSLVMVAPSEGFPGSTFVFEDVDIGGITSVVADAVSFLVDAGCGVFSRVVDSKGLAIVLIPALGFVYMTLVPQSITKTSLFYYP